MPLVALSAKARLMVPVGAIDSRCELRRPCCADAVLASPAGRREAKLLPRQVQVGVEQREGAALARQLDRGLVGASRITSEMLRAPCARGLGVS